MNRNRKVLKIAYRTTALALAAAVAFPGAASGLPLAPLQKITSMSTVKAAKDPITYEYYTTVLHNVVPASWLFVGTYLMSAKGVTAQIYQAALDSRSEYEQPIAYYSSELDEGAWKNIKNASSLTTILPYGGRVEDTELFPYYITVVVGDDGIPRDPVTGEPVDIYNMESIYDMNNIPELDYIRAYKESGSVSVMGDNSQAYIAKMLFYFFENSDLDYDRASLSVALAFDQYKELSKDPNKLEDIWDTALAKAEVTWPSEYKEVMQVMKNWPNIRDDITDLNDAQESALNEMFLSFSEKAQSEEADSTLYVQRQVDGTRRAEIYYNLTKNDNLTGSYGLVDPTVDEAFNLRKAEINSEIGNLAVETDRVAAPYNTLQEKINALKVENDQKTKAISDENERWEERWNGDLMNMDNAFSAANTGLRMKEDEFAPIKAHYEALDAELDAIYNESTAADESQTALEDEIDDLKMQKIDAQFDIEDKLAELSSNLQSLKSRKASAEQRKSEYEETKAEIAKLDEKIDRLNFNLENEKAAYDELVKQAESYTTSRFTAAFDSTKTFDIQKKQDLDYQVETKHKLVETLGNSVSVAQASRLEKQKIVQSIEADLYLDEEIEGAQQTYDNANETYPKMLATTLAALDEQIAANEAKLAADSPAFQEKLRRLKAKSEEFDAYEPTYLEKKAEVDELQQALDDLQKEKEDHEQTIALAELKIKENEAKIAELEEQLDGLQAPIAVASAKVDALQSELAKLEPRQAEAKAARSPYGVYILALEDQIQTLRSSINAMNADQAAIPGRKAENLTRVSEDQKKIADLKAEAKTAEDNFLPGWATLAKEHDEKLTSLKTELAAKEAEKNSGLSGIIESQDVKDQIKAIDDKLTELNRIMDILTECETLEYNIKGLERTVKNAENEKQRHDSISNDSVGLWTWLGWIFGFGRYYDYSTINAESNRLGEQLKAAREGLVEGRKKLTDKEKELPNFTSKDTLAGYRYKKTNEYDDLVRQRGQVLANQGAEVVDYTNRLDGEIAEIREKLSQAELEQNEAFATFQKTYEDGQKARQDEIAFYEQEIEDLYAANTSLTELDASYTEDIAAKNQDIENLNLKIEEMKEKDSAFSADDKFGVAPTLVFLKNAAYNGNPGMGRKFKRIAGNRGIGSFDPNTKLTEMIEDAIAQCDNAYEKYLKKAMSRGETAADYTGFLLSRKVASSAPDEEASKPYLQMITDLNNVEAGEVVHSTREISLLYGWLLPFALQDFQTNKNTTAQEKYQFYIQGLTERDTLENSITFVKGRLEHARNMRSEFNEAGKTEVIESHITWLDNLLRSLMEQAGLLDDDDGNGDKDELEDMRAVAEEAGDIKTMRKIDDLLAKLRNDGKIADGDGEGDYDNEPDDLEPTDIDPNNRPTSTQEILDLILTEAKKDGYDIKKDLNRFSASGGKLGDLKKALEDAGASPRILQEVGDAEENEPEAFKPTGDVMPESGGMDMDGLKDAIDGLLEGQDDAGQAAIVGALAEAAESSGNDELLDYLLGLLDDLLKNGNTCIYRQYMGDTSREYVSLGAIDRCRNRSGFRYVKKRSDVTMSQVFGGSASYTFTVGQTTVKKNNGEVGKLQTNVVEQEDKYLRQNSETKYAYISEDDAQRYLGNTCVYIHKTDWAILVTPPAKALLEEVGRIINQYMDSTE